MLASVYENGVVKNWRTDFVKFELLWSMAFIRLLCLLLSHSWFSDEPQTSVYFERLVLQS